MLATSTELLWLQPDPLCGPHDAKSGQRAYLRQINQQSQVVSRLETICLGSVLSTVSRQKPRQIWMSWTEPKEPGELSRSTPSGKIYV